MTGRDCQDRRALELARRRHDVVCAAELAAIGLDRHAVARRVAQGTWVRLHAGVFASAAAELSPEGRTRAAVLACAPALASHRSAVALWGLLPEWNGPVDVLVHGRTVTPRAGIVVHRTRWLPDTHRSNRNGVPVVSPARAVLDAGPLLGVAEHELVVAAALRTRRATIGELTELAATRRPGARQLRTQLGRVGGPQVTRSRAERLLLQLIREAELEPPEANVRVLGRERDLVWVAARVVAEFDGFAFHWSPAAMAMDRRRDAELAARGWRPVRYTWIELTERPVVVIARLASALAIGNTLAEWVSGSTPPA